MKRIEEYINESLVNEGLGQLVVFISHDYPGTINIIKNVTNKKYVDKLIEDISGKFSIEVAPYNAGNIYEIIYSDEKISINDTGCKSEKELKDAVEKSIGESLQKYDDDSKKIEVDFSPLQIKESFKAQDKKLVYYSEMKNTPVNSFYRWLIKYYAEFTPNRNNNDVKVVWSSSDSRVTSYNNIIFGDVQIFTYKNEKEFERYRKKYLDF